MSGKALADRVWLAWRAGEGMGRAGGRHDRVWGGWREVGPMGRLVRGGEWGANLAP